MFAPSTSISTLSFVFCLRVLLLLYVCGFRPNNGGGKCWCCDDVTILVPLDHVLANVRWGSFLRTIKTDRRVGDVVQGACRVSNAFKKRLFDDIAWWLVGVVGQRAMAREFHEIWAELLHEARSIPAAERKELLP